MLNVLHGVIITNDYMTVHIHLHESSIYIPINYLGDN